MIKQKYGTKSHYQQIAQKYTEVGSFTYEFIGNFRGKEENF
jgi:hypothetical protein